MLLIVMLLSSKKKITTVQFLSYSFAFVSFALLHLFFTLNFIVFVDGGARMFLALGRRVP